MNPTIVLGEHDRSTLSALLHHKIPGLIPHPKAYDALRSFINSAKISNDEHLLDAHVALGDLVILGSPRNARSVRIVTPEDARENTGCISILSPLGLSVLGQKVGSTVTWPSGNGQQQAVIREVLKDSLVQSTS